MDIDSLMNSVIEEHMGGKKVVDGLHRDATGCHFGRQNSATGDTLGGELSKLT